MIAGGGGGGGQQSDNSMAVLWIVAGIFIFGWVIWTFFRVQIITFVFHIRLAELDVIGMFTHQLDWVTTLIRETPPSQANFQTLDTVSTAVGNILRYPLGVITVIFGFMVYYGNPVSTYKAKYSMQRLLDAEKVNWPQVMPVANIDLVPIPLSEGPWAIGLSPMEFCQQHSLLEEEQEGGVFNPHIKKTATLIRDKAEEVLTAQMGRLWTSVEALPMHAQALLAIFAARANGDRDEATTLVQQIAKSTEKGNLHFHGVREVLRKHFNTKIVQRVVQTHAYERTVLAAMLVSARNDGVLATCDFLWLKPVDRLLWYTLNTVGRHTPMSEVAGIIAHWKVEEELGRPIRVPMVEEAVNALEEALSNVIYKPKDERD